MVDDTSLLKLKGDLTITENNFGVPSILPSQMRNGNTLYTIMQKIESIDWEKEGKELLSKTYFTQEDHKIAKLLIFKGVPNNLRGMMWFVSTGAKREMKDHPGYYHFLLNGYPKELELPNEHQIDLDLLRTFPEDPYFHNSATQKKLRNILLSYSKRNLSIGYVQGFNFIAGRIIKFVPDEEEAFWIFTQIIENILPINFYSELVGVMIDVDILVCLFNQKYFKGLSEAMGDGLFIYLRNILFQWFLSLFLVHFSYEASLIIWDVLFLEKSVVLFKAAVSLIKKIKHELANIPDLETLKNFLKEYFANYNNLSYLKFALILRKFEFNSDFIEQNRSLLELQMNDQIKQNQSGKIQKLKEKLMLRDDLCNQNWPFCIYDAYSPYTVINHFVLKSSTPPIVIDEYFLPHSKVNDTKDDDYSVSLNVVDFESALIERKDHYCDSKHQARTRARTITEEMEDSSVNLSTGTGDKSMEKSGDQDSECMNISNEMYQLTKQRYKRLRQKTKWVSSLAYKQQIGMKQEQQEKCKNFEAFVSKMNYHYNNLSMINGYCLNTDKLNQSYKSVDISFEK